jgi:hypothetical protein
MKSFITGLDETTPFTISNLGRPFSSTLRALISDTTIRYTNILLDGEAVDHITYRV